MRHRGKASARSPSTSALRRARYRNGNSSGRPRARIEELGEAEDWSVAQQKLALAYRGAGNLGQAQRFIDVARASGVGDTPMQRVRWSTAQAHILLTDTATRARGLALLDETTRLAVQCGLSHQLRSIETIRRDLAHAAGTGKGTT